jgi:hypothetical protein
MVDSFWRDTPERECRDDEICRSWRDELSDMGSTDSMDITVLPVLVAELDDAFWIVLDDDEPSSWRLVCDELSRNLSIV